MTCGPVATMTQRNVADQPARHEPPRALAVTACRTIRSEPLLAEAAFAVTPRLVRFCSLHPSAHARPGAKTLLVALAAAVVLPELVSALSYPVLCLIGMVLHIMRPSAFSYKGYGPHDGLLRAGKEKLLIYLKYFYISSSLKTCMIHR